MQAQQAAAAHASQTRPVQYISIYRQGWLGQSRSSIRVRRLHRPTCIERPYEYLLRAISWPVHLLPRCVFRSCPPACLRVRSLLRLSLYTTFRLRRCLFFRLVSAGSAQSLPCCDVSIPTRLYSLSAHRRPRPSFSESTSIGAIRFTRTPTTNLPATAARPEPCPHFHLHLTRCFPPPSARAVDHPPSTFAPRLVFEHKSI